MVFNLLEVVGSIIVVVKRIPGEKTGTGDGFVVTSSVVGVLCVPVISTSYRWYDVPND